MHFSGVKKVYTPLRTSAGILRSVELVCCDVAAMMDFNAFSKYSRGSGLVRDDVTMACVRTRMHKEGFVRLLDFCETVLGGQCY